MPDEQNIYYHYTSVEALYNIVKTRTFWLVNSKSSNDKTEGVFTEEEFNRIIKLAREKIPNEKKSDFDILFTQKASIDDLSNKNNYILCLSKSKDSLAHWDRYASFRKGICFCIDIKKTDKYYKRFPNYFQICELGYRDDDLKTEVVNGFENYLKMYMLNLPNETREMLKKINVDLIYSSLVSKKKSPYFKDEKEIRIKISSEIYLREVLSETKGLESIKKDCFSNLEKLDIEKTYFEPIRGEIRSLHHLCLKDIWGSDLIPEIMLGPNCPQSKDELRYFLDENGLKDTKVTESEIPIR